MKTKFTFTIDLGQAELLETQKIKFAASGEIAVREGEVVVPRHVENYNVEIELEPEKDGQRAGEWAKLNVTVQGTPDSHWPFTERIAHQVADHLSFYYPKLRFLAGLMFAERIPEDDAERAAIGDKPMAARAHLIEAEPPRVFDREHLRLFPYSFGVQRVMRQFAAAEASDNPIDAFLNMFKVVETLYHRGKLRAREAFRRSDEFREILRDSFRTTEADVTRIPNDDDVDGMISSLVEVRDSCAHLRDHDAFGYAPRDPEVFSRVRPLYEILAIAARRAIQKRIADEKARNQPPAGDA